MRTKDPYRQAEIREYIKRKGYTSVEQLKQDFAISGATVRRDLGTLEQAGDVVRIYGGAYWRESETIHYSLRNKINSEAKLAIARKAAEFIEEGDTIFLDPGTTIEQLSTLIRTNCRQMKLTVLTTSLLAFTPLAGLRKYCHFSAGRAL